MAQTGRIGRSLFSPSTDYWLGADIISQNQAGNTSKVRVSNQSINRGDSSSFSGDNGTHVCQIDGIGSNTIGPGPLGSGYANGQVRWDVSKDYDIGHNADGTRGNVTLRQVVTAWHSSDANDTVSWGSFPRIPKRPSPPGTPVASAILPTSLTLTWPASTDNAGSTITGYRVRRWTGPTATGPYVDISETNTLTRNDTGLTPGTTYTYGIYAKNGSADNGGYSNVSTTVTVKTIAPVRVKVAGIWKYAVPYVKVAGVWKQAQPYVKVAGIWKATG